MKGIPLGDLDAGLTRVPVHLNRKPIRSFDAMSALGEKFRAYALDYYGTDNVEKIVHKLPAQAFHKLGTDRAAKTMLSNEYSIPSEVEREIEKDPILRAVRKIDSSVWRWGIDRCAWNDIVSALEGISSFTLER